jgi:hypothetical protein
MALTHSPRIVTDGLVFAYDMGNPDKSWRGAPTVNLITNPFCLNNTGPGIIFSGYEASATVVPALNDDMRSISPFWVQYVKTSSTNGRVWFLGGGAGSFLTGTDYTYSVYVYTSDTRVTGFTLGSDNGTVSNTTQVLSSWSASDIGKVKRISAVFRSLAGSNSQGCRITASNPIGTTFYMSAYQCEQQSIATPPVVGTRSNTQAIVDLTRNSTVTATSLTYASDGTFNFNGGTDSLFIPGTIGPITNYSFSMCAWINSTNIAATQNVLSMNGPYFMRIFSSRVRFNVLVGGTWLFQGGNRVLNSNTWYHLCMVYNYAESTWTGYINGEQDFSVTKTGTHTYTNFYGYVGYTPQGGEQSNFLGQIPVVQYYDGALSVQEVRQNFNALRGRYGI